MRDADDSRPGLMQTRYAILQRPRKDPYDEDEVNNETKEYAGFLKEAERKVGPDGYVDSYRFKKPFAMRAKEREQSEDENMGATARGKDNGHKKPLTVVDLMNKYEIDKKEHGKRVKAIEDHMWQHKQAERELKRVEGDIIKNQQVVRRSLKDYENAIVRKRLSEEKKLSQGMEKYTRLQQSHAHKKEDLTKQRIEKSLSADQTYKDKGRKVQLITTDLARQYRTKMSDLDVKRIEVERLSKEFESKLRKKEEEQYKLKQELAELAIVLNMEAHKGRSMENDFKKEQQKDRTSKVREDLENKESLENKLAKSEGDTKAAEMNRRKLSADMNVTRSRLQLKQREEGRHLQDTQNRLGDNINVQKQLNEAALHAELDLKAKNIQNNIQNHDNRRYVRATQVQRQRKEKQEAHEAQYSVRFKVRLQDQMRREHEDHLKHFQKSVTHGEEVESDLYNQVRNSEYARQKQEQQVRRLHNKYYELKRNNAAKLKREMTDCMKEETEISQDLQKAQALLAKVHAKREQSYMRLQQHRNLLREEKFQLDRHESEHQRLVRVGQRTDSVMGESY